MKSLIPILTTCLILLCMAEAVTFAQVQPGLPGLTQAAPSRVLQTSNSSTGFAAATTATMPEDTGNILIPGPQADPNRLNELAADLLVMCRIFDKTVTRTSVMGDMGMDAMYEPILPDFRLLGPAGVLDRFVNPCDSKTKALYVQGYGVVFTVNVRFPLMPTPEPPGEAPTTEPTDPLWSQTREEIFEPHRANEDAKASDYKAEQVDRLKRQLKDALRYAANIRHMAPGEHVTLAVRGSGGSATGFYPVVATITLRVRKSDADARAAGTLTAEAFAGKIEVIEF